MAKKRREKAEKKRKLPLTFSYKHPAGARKANKRDAGFDISTSPFVPVIPLKVNGVYLEGLLDSGCSSFLIPRKLEPLLKLTYTGRSVGHGVSGAFNQLETTVSLTIGTGPRAIDIGMVKAYVPEDKNQDNPILIGQTVFEHMIVTFDKKNNTVTLIPNGDEE